MNDAQAANPPIQVSPFDRVGHLAVRLMVAGVLLVAMFMKTRQWTVSFILEEDSMKHRLAFATLIAFEAVLGGMLLAGVFPNATRALALACFVAFTSVTVYKGIAGETSCGCLGDVRIDPWYMAAFDVAAVASLVWYRPVQHRPAMPCLRFPLAAAPLIAAIAMASAAILRVHAKPTPGVDPFAGKSDAVIRPREWLGKACPLLPYIDAAAPLSKGDWVLVLYRHDCEDCRAAIPKYRRLAQQRQVAFIEVPPYGGDALRSQLGPRAILARLSDTKTWYVRTPVVLRVVDGTVSEIIQAGD
jgi:hypothetical protein